MNIVFKTENNFPTNTEFVQQWKALNSPSRFSVFCDPDWYRCYLDTYCKDSSFLITSAYDGDELVAVFPLAKQRMNKFGLFLPTTEVIAGRRSDYWCPVIKEGYEEVVLDSFLNQRLKDSDITGTVILPNMPASHPSYSLTQKFLQGSRIEHHLEDSVCPWFDFEPTYDDMQMKWNKKHRGDVRRLRRRLTENVAEPRLHIVKTQEEALELLPSFFDMHNTQWLSRGMAASFTDEMSKRLFYNLVEHLWDDYVNYSILYCGDEPISCHFGFISGGYLLWYKPTFNIDFKKYAPTKIHLAMIIEHMINEGHQGMDFIQGAEAYKSDWSDQVESTSSFIIKTKSMSPAYYWITKGRPVAEQKFEGIYNKTSSLIQNYKSSDKN